jgi:hypothetical protein
MKGNFIMADYNLSLTAEELQTEEWRVVPGYEDSYAVSNLGRVKRIKKSCKHISNKLLAWGGKKTHYPHVTLFVNGTKKCFTVHGIVARAFLGPCPEGKEVNHKDGNKRNPRLTNLEYITNSENKRHAIETGLRVALKGSEMTQSILDEQTVIEICKALQRGESQTSIATRFKVSNVTISDIDRGVTWKHVTSSYLHKSFPQPLRPAQPKMVCECPGCLWLNAATNRESLMVACSALSEAQYAAASVDAQALSA